MPLRFAVPALLICVLALGASSRPTEADAGVTVAILHVNDASSALPFAGPGLEDFGGAARFKAVLDRERAAATARHGDIALVLNAGNNLQVGPILDASIEHGVPYYDATAMLLMRYDAAILGDRDFDSGPERLADFLCGPDPSRGVGQLPAVWIPGPSCFPLRGVQSELRRRTEASGVRNHRRHREAHDGVEG